MTRIWNIHGSRSKSRPPGPGGLLRDSRRADVGQRLFTVRYQFLEVLGPEPDVLADSATPDASLPYGFCHPSCGDVEIRRSIFNAEKGAAWLRELRSSHWPGRHGAPDCRSVGVSYQCRCPSDTVKQLITAQRQRKLRADIPELRSLSQSDLQREVPPSGRDCRALIATRKSARVIAALPGKVIRRGLVRSCRRAILMSEVRPSCRRGTKTSRI